MEINWLPLSHHLARQRHRCLGLPLAGRRVLICARCLGLYPTMIAVMAAQWIWGWARPGTLDWWIAIAGALPGLIDWGLGRLGRRGRNDVRVLTGVLLGVALGRTLACYVVDPAYEVFWVQAALLVIGAAAFEGAARWRHGSGRATGP